MIQRASLLLFATLLGCSSGEGEIKYSNPEDLRSGGDLPPEQAPSDDESTPAQDLTSAIESLEPIAACPKDTCPSETGVIWRCQKRFMYGSNLAWGEFGGDFGGIQRWGVRSVSENRTHFSNILKDAKAHGVNVLRWWMFPDFRGDGIVFDDAGKPTGLSDGLLDDVAEALNLAALHDVYLMLTLFSFDGFFPVDGTDKDWTTHLTPIALDPVLRKALNDNVIVPLARLVENHPHRIRLHSWDLMNEPEWAIMGPALYGGPSFAPITSPVATDAITHAEMELFLSEINAVLRQESSALITVGGSLKWAKAWTGLDLDYYQLHYYPWMEPTYTFNRTPEEIGLTDLPLVLGEFPATADHQQGSPYTYQQVVTQLLDKGWAGALGWDFQGASEDDKDDILPFAEQHSCQTSY